MYPPCGADGAGVIGVALELGDSGAALPNATVSIHNVETGIDRTTQTGSSGSYSVSQLPPGHYTLTVVQSGLRAFSSRTSPW